MWDAPWENWQMGFIAQQGPSPHFEEVKSNIEQTTFNRNKVVKTNMCPKATIFRFECTEKSLLNTDSWAVPQESSASVGLKGSQESLV